MIDIINMNAFIAFIISIVTQVLLTYAFFRQMPQVMLPKDWLTPLRWGLLIFIGLSIATLFPVLIYQGMRAFGNDIQTLRAIAAITGRISQLCQAFLFVMLFNYKIKG